MLLLSYGVKVVDKWGCLSRQFLLVYLIFAHLASTAETCIYTRNKVWNIDFVSDTISPIWADTAGLSGCHAAVGCMIQCD